MLNLKLTYMHSCIQARSQVLRFWGENTFLRGQYVCFYFMFETNFPGHNKILGDTNIFGGELPPNPPMATGQVVYLQKSDCT